MNEGRADCTALVKCTAKVLNDRSLESLVVSDQYPKDRDLESPEDNQDQPDRQREGMLPNRDDKQNSSKVS